MAKRLNSKWPALMARLSAVTALALCLIGGLTANADAKSKELTPKAVKQFIASYPDVKSIVVAEARDKASGVSNVNDGLAVIIRAASDEKVQKRIDSAVKAHGFSGSEDWFQVAASVGQAYAHIKTGAGDGKAQRKIEKAVAKIEKMDFLSEKQKQKLIQEVREKAGIVLETPPPQNIAAVQPMLGEIEAVMK